MADAHRFNEAIGQIIRISLSTVRSGGAAGLGLSPAAAPEWQLEQSCRATCSPSTGSPGRAGAGGVWQAVAITSAATRTPVRLIPIVLPPLEGRRALLHKRPGRFCMVFRGRGP